MNNGLIELEGKTYKSYKEIFYEFIKNNLHSKKAYSIAQTYYSNEASTDEKHLFDSFLGLIKKVLKAKYIKGETHFKSCANRYGLSTEQAKSIIGISEESDTKKNYLETIYNESLKREFQKESLVVLSKTLEISYTALFCLLKDYLYNYLKLPELEIKNILKKAEPRAFEEFELFMSGFSVNNFKYVIWYYEHIASPIEQAEYRGRLAKILLEEYDPKLTSEQNSYKIYEKYHIIPQYIKSEIRIINKFGLYNGLRIVSKEGILAEKSEDLVTIFINYFRKDQSVSFIKNWLEDNKINWDDFCCIYLPKIKLRLENNLYQTLLSQIKSINSSYFNNEKELKLLEAKRVIINFLHSGKKISLYQKKFSKDFAEFIFLIQLYEPKLYSLYEAKVNNIPYSLDQSLLKEMVFKIRENNFNILDYYELIGIPINELEAYLDTLEVEDREIIKEFIKNGKDGHTPYMSYMRESDMSIEQEKKIINNLTSRNIPILISTFKSSASEISNSKRL